MYLLNRKHFWLRKEISGHNIFVFLLYSVKHERGSKKALIIHVSPLGALILALKQKYISVHTYMHTNNIHVYSDY